MGSAILRRVTVHQLRLEIPLADFDDLPAELGCSLHRHANELSLGDGDSNVLHFAVQGEVALLTRLHIDNDRDGEFCRDVLGLLAQVYGGDVDAELEWQPRGAMDARMVIVEGESSHPLLFQSTESRESVERLLEEARHWWNEYQARVEQNRRVSGSRTQS